MRKKPSASIYLYRFWVTKAILLSSFGYSQTKQELENQKSNVEQQLNQKNAQIQSTQNEIIKLEKESIQFEEQANINERKISTLQSKIAELQQNPTTTLTGSHFEGLKTKYFQKWVRGYGIYAEYEWLTTPFYVDSIMSDSYTQNCHTQPPNKFWWGGSCEERYKKTRYRLFLS